MIVVIDSRLSEPKNVLTFKNTEAEEAEKEYINFITENNVEIEDPDHRDALLDDGICETVDGYVAIYWT